MTQTQQILAAKEFLETLKEEGHQIKRSRFDSQSSFIYALTAKAKDIDEQNEYIRTLMLQLPKVKSFEHVSKTFELPMTAEQDARNRNPSLDRNF